MFFHYAVPCTEFLFFVYGILLMIGIYNYYGTAQDLNMVRASMSGLSNAILSGTSTIC